MTCTCGGSQKHPTGESCGGESTILNEIPELVSTVHLVWADDNGARLFLGAEDAITADFIQACEIETVFTLNTEPSSIIQTMTHVQGVEHVFLPFLDHLGKYQSPEQERNAAQAIQRVAEDLRQGKRIAVHCRAGFHRSPTVVYHALVLNGKFATAYDAYCHVRRIRSEVGFVKSLVKWSKKMHQREFP